MPTTTTHWFTSYRDLPAALTRHSWLALSYALASVILIYTLGLWSSGSLLFFAFLVPTLASAVYVTSANPDLKVRLPVLWSLTALIVWAYRVAGDMRNVAWPVDLLSLGVIFLIVYWLTLAVRVSKAEFNENKRAENTTAALGWLLSTWGATLQIAFIALLFVKYVLHDILSDSSLGRVVVGALQTIRLTSPVMWLPSGVFAIGITFFAVLLFADFPYHAMDFKNVLPTKLPPVANEIFAAIRIPVWLVVVIIGFLIHFVYLLGHAFLKFGDKWAGRFLLVMVALIAPTLTLLAGHSAFFSAMWRISQNLSGRSGGNAFFLFLTVHVFVLLGLFLYVVASAPIGLDVFPISVRKAPPLIKEYFAREGFLAAQAIGKAFALYGIVFLAVPLASLLPGGTKWGVFSTCYTAMIAGVAVVYFLRVARYWHQKKAMSKGATVSEERLKAG